MLLDDALLATLEPAAVERGSLRVEDGRIVERGPQLAAQPGEEVIALGGALVLPGFVNAHTHLYSALARGMPPPAEPPHAFVEILERVWWRLDRALDGESLRLSALVGAVEAARSGTTTLVDHHASPTFVRGSLDVLRGAVEAVGLRSVLCYETTDRNGPAGRDEGLGENRAFLGAGRSPLTRARVGAHASFTLSDETLGSLSRLVAESGAGLHVHAAEDEADVDDSLRRCGKRVVERLEARGLLANGALLAHGVHLSDAEIERVTAAGAWLLHCPRSNMGNAVGHAPAHLFRRAALGTDGIDQDLLAEARAAFFRMRDAGRDDALGRALSMLAGGQQLAARIFGEALGTMEPGAPADLVVLDYAAPTPLTAANLAGHLLFGIDRSHVRSTLVAGRFVLRDRQLVTVDEAAVFARARDAAAGLWKRMAQLR